MKTDPCRNERQRSEKIHDSLVGDTVVAFINPSPGLLYCISTIPIVDTDQASTVLPIADHSQSVGIFELDGASCTRTRPEVLDAGEYDSKGVV